MQIGVSGGHTPAGRAHYKSLLNEIGLYDVLDGAAFLTQASAVTVVGESDVPRPSKQRTSAEPRLLRLREAGQDSPGWMAAFPGGYL